MADPAWDIHMEVENALIVGGLFVSSFTHSYKRCDEIIWVKINQLQRLIRTGRTGHWLNHGKEHCLVGIKGNPTGYNKLIDCDVIVSEVRDTSHKPDEIYAIIERMWPNARKIGKIF
ncbi:hypothetical protein HZS_2096 [Henneguya salminicola]|nr:hypothetical protein HZS_2096 [Henneguya salminicola]